jgi:hypothetical protein
MVGRGTDVSSGIDLSAFLHALLSVVTKKKFAESFQRCSKKLKKQLSLSEKFELISRNFNQLLSRYLKSYRGMLGGKVFVSKNEDYFNEFSRKKQSALL